MQMLMCHTLHLYIERQSIHGSQINLQQLDKQRIKLPEHKAASAH